VAAATAVHASRGGHKTLLLSTGPTQSLADALSAPVGPEPTEVEAGLYAQHVSPRARLGRDWERLAPRFARLLDDLGIDVSAAEQLPVLPAAAEVLTLLELRDRARAGTWDLVVVDCGPSVAALRLLGLPESLSSYLDRSMPPGRRVARAVRHGGAGTTGQDIVLDELRRLADELADVAALLHDAATGVRLVLTPERLVLADTLRTVTHLGLLGHGVEAVVVNRLVAPGTDPTTRTRSARQRRLLAEARAAAGDIPVLVAQEGRDEPVGMDALAEVGGLLHAAPDAVRHLLEPPGRPGTVRVERGGDHWFLLVGLPHARRDEVGLLRRGDDLEMSVGPAHRLLRLPSVLRRCRVVGARLRDGELRVEFAPDPALWPDLGGRQP
jgi:arsenite-transporting ATPase